MTTYLHSRSHSKHEQVSGHVVLLVRLVALAVLFGWLLAPSAFARGHKARLSEDLSAYLDPSCPYEFVHLRNFDEHSLRLFFERIAGQEVLTHTLAGYRNGPLRFAPAFGLGARVLRRLAAMLEGLGAAGAATARRLRERMLMPGEINLVVRKRTAAGTEPGSAAA